MKKFAIAAAAGVLLATPAFADSKVEGDELKKLTEAAASYGFTGGEAEKETEGSGVYEIDDAKGKDGAQYDVKFDKDMKLLSVTRD